MNRSLHRLGFSLRCGVIRGTARDAKAWMAGCGRGRAAGPRPCYASHSVTVDPDMKSAKGYSSVYILDRKGLTAACLHPENPASEYAWCTDGKESVRMYGATSKQLRDADARRDSINEPPPRLGTTGRRSYSVIHIFRQELRRVRQSHSVAPMRIPRLVGSGLKSESRAAEKGPTSNGSCHFRLS